MKTRLISLFMTPYIVVTVAQPGQLQVDESALVETSYRVKTDRESHQNSTALLFK